MADLPHITNSNYTNSTYNGPDLSMGYVNTSGTAGDVQARLLKIHPISDQLANDIVWTGPQTGFTTGTPNTTTPLKEFKVADPKRRIVKVIVIDPDNNVPLDKCVLHSGCEQLTDLNDQELFFEINIKKSLDSHNELRKTLINKTVKDRRETLEPIKIRDLRMVVVTVAQF